MNADSFHRLMKLLVDSGEASTIEEAISTFSAYGVRLVLTQDVESSLGFQMIALTVINTAARSFQGNVQIVGDSSMQLLAPGFEGVSLSQFSAWAGVNPTCSPTSSWPEIHVGERNSSTGKASITPWATGWAFGFGNPPAAALEPFAPACVAAGALAVSEAFSLLRGDNPYAGRRAVSFSLWSMKADTAQPPAGTSTAITRGLWLIGLGHLGQAYCWTLGLMPKTQHIPLVLQDVDTVTQSTLTTSVLSCPSDLGHKKTRVVANWLEHRGFETRLVERRFDAATRIAPGDPITAIFGVDNAGARRACESAGFSLVLDAGLGSGHRDFRALRVRGFPGASSAAQIWANDTGPSVVSLAPAYRALVAAGKDACGVTTLATRSVGAPFVGCYAAAILVAELFRRFAAEPGNDVIDIHLRNPESVELA